MENASYATLTRMSGLLREIDTVANNIANMSTTGFRREGLVFAEFIRDTGPGQASLSMGYANARASDLTQGALTRTNGTFDLAIEGPGFFLVDTPGGERLTRAGAFTPNEVGDIVTPDGHRLLDEGGAPVFVPPDAASVFDSRGRHAQRRRPAARAEGESASNLPADPLDLARCRRCGLRGAWRRRAHRGPDAPGFIEESNVNAVTEIARMMRGPAGPRTRPGLPRQGRRAHPLGNPHPDQR